MKAWPQLRLQTVFSPLPFAYPPGRTVREWREKSEGSDAISVYFSHSHTQWKRSIWIHPSIILRRKIWDKAKFRIRAVPTFE